MDRLHPDDIAAIARAVADEFDRRAAVRSHSIRPRRRVETIADYARYAQQWRVWREANPDADSAESHAQQRRIAKECGVE